MGKDTEERMFVLKQRNQEDQQIEHEEEGRKLVLKQKRLSEDKKVYEKEKVEFLKQKKKMEREKQSQKQLDRDLKAERDQKEKDKQELKQQREELKQQREQHLKRMEEDKESFKQEQKQLNQEQKDQRELHSKLMKKEMEIQKLEIEKIKERKKENDKLEQIEGEKKLLLRHKRLEEDMKFAEKELTLMKQKQNDLAQWEKYLIQKETDLEEEREKNSSIGVELLHKEVQIRVDREKMEDDRKYLSSEEARLSKIRKDTSKQQEECKSLLNLLRTKKVNKTLKNILQFHIITVLPFLYIFPLSLYFHDPFGKQTFIYRNLIKQKIQKHLIYFSITVFFSVLS